ncbi:tyrosine-protein kinase STYK1 [Chanos chanos]|uniref:Tyrosine-protein kinase STYK1 n=1 Tax=Chanos chanos TaxID=29144 RepID=A0A6J2WIF7_CHACN|nr:tyrosine-protein kinase STYK1-like [Chanos chanos]
MASYSDNLCAANDTLCLVREYQLDIIVVPALLLSISLILLLIVFILRCCAAKSSNSDSAQTKHVTHHHHSAHRHQHRDTHQHRHRDSHHHTHQQHHNHRRNHTHRQHLRGIDAPPELNPMEGEVLPMTVQTHARNTKPTPPQSGPTEWHSTSFRLVTPLPLSFSVRPEGSISLHRASVDRRAVILRVLKETADADERQSFINFGNFLSELGPHPFLPALVGVVSRRTPLTIVMEELGHGDLLGFLWRCREDHPTAGRPCDLTEKRIFTMAGQVASALEYLHRKNCIHGNIGARSVLVGRDLTVKLWGLGPAFRRRLEVGTPGELEDMELRKWQAPEVLAHRPHSHSSDVWSFGILLYEMATLGDPPFPRIMASELLQYLQRGKTVKRPVNCSNTLYSLIKACCQWVPQDRPPLAELIQKLQSGERSANDSTVLRVPEPLDIEKYMREAGYGEAFNYAVL